MNKKNNNINIIIALLFAVILLVGGFFAFKLLKKDTDTEDMLNIKNRKMIEHVLSYEDDGIISYQTIDGKELDTFDLKTLSTPRIEKVKEVVKKEIEVPVEKKVKKKVEKPIETKKTFKDFEQFERKIVKGENAWTIQEQLTPNEPIIVMWQYIKEINDYAMHPIYPNETWIFLREKTGKKESEVVEEYETIIEKEIQVIEEVVENEIEIKEDSYIYYEDFKNEKLYAHSDMERTVYEIQVKEDKITVEEVIKHDYIDEPHYFVTDGVRAYFAYKDSSSGFAVNKESMEAVSLHKKPEKMEILNGVMFYVSDEYMGNYNFENKKINQALVGDKLVNMFKSDDKIHLLNKFGSGHEKNLYYEIEPVELVVSNAIEIPSNESTMLTTLDNEFLWFSILEKTGAQNTKQVKDEKLLSLDYKTLKEVDFGSWKMNQLDNGEIYDGYIYSKTDKGLDIYLLKQEKKVDTKEIKGSHIMLLK